MSPRAAWRLEALGFEQVHDYVPGKVDWLANGLPREGDSAAIPSAGELLDADPTTCELHDSVGHVRGLLGDGNPGFCLVLNEQRIVLGRIRRSALDGAHAAATVEALMEAGPSTVRPNTPVRDVVERLAKRDLKTAVVTTPGGCLIGVFHRVDAEQRLVPP